MAMLEDVDRWLVDKVGWIAFRTGLPWLTPFVGVIDCADLNQLRGHVEKDVRWIDRLLATAGADQAGALKLASRGLARATAGVLNVGSYVGSSGLGRSPSGLADRSVENGDSVTRSICRRTAANVFKASRCGLTNSPIFGPGIQSHDPFAPSLRSTDL
jgi:hypothetical protein